MVQPPKPCAACSPTKPPKSINSFIQLDRNVARLVEAAENPRDKALLMTLYESGGRIGEVGSLKIRDVEFKENHAQMNQVFGWKQGK